MGILNNGLSLTRFGVVFTIVCILGLSPVHANSEKKADEETQAAADKAPPLPVTVSKVEERNFISSETFNGRIEAIESAALYARVLGYMEKRNFEEGAVVQKGDILYELDDKTYNNALEQARAELQIAKANSVWAQKEFVRQNELTQRNVQSRAALDEAKARLDSSHGEVAAATARVEEAQINLNYTKIIAPLTGRISRSAVSIGDLVSPESGVMATIVQTDPIYISFPVPQKVLLEVQKKNNTKEDVYVKLTLADGTIYKHQGKISFADVTATASTDTIIVRATVPNPDGTLIDQGLIDVSVVSDKENKVLAIPQQSLLLDQQGAYVLVVDDKNTVQQIQIKTGDQQGSYMEVKSGLKPGMQVITSGLQKVRPGMQVKPSLVKNDN